MFPFVILNAAAFFSIFSLAHLPRWLLQVCKFLRGSSTPFASWISFGSSVSKKFFNTSFQPSCCSWIFLIAASVISSSVITSLLVIGCSVFLFTSIVSFVSSCANANVSSYAFAAAGMSGFSYLIYP